TKITDPTHTNRFNYYVPFYPFLLGLLSKPHPGIKTIFFICSLFSTANIFLYTRHLARNLTAYTSKAVQVMALLSIPYVATYLLFITAELLDENVRTTIITNSLRFAAILLLFCLVLAISPNGLANTITGIRLHVTYVLDRTDRSVSLFLYYWLLAPLNIGFL